MNKKEINQFVKAGDVQGVILAYELEEKRKAGLIENKIVPLFNELSIVQRIEMKRHLDNGKSLGVPETLKERLTEMFKKTKQSHRSYWNDQAETDFVYYTRFNN